jgi:hypothetical protein
MSLASFRSDSFVYVRILDIGKRSILLILYGLGKELLDRVRRYC